MEKVVLEVNSLKRRPRVNGISFQLFQGEVLGITGLRGAGKTELSRLLFGADKLESGEIIIKGTSVRINTPLDALNNGISLVPEDRKKDALILMLELYKNITLPTLRNFTKKEIILSNKEIDAANQAIEKLDIKASSARQITRYLSGGNQQKVAISKWLHANPKVLIMDEPTQGIDVKAKLEIFNIVRVLAETGVCIIFISSEISEIVKDLIVFSFKPRKDFFNSKEAEWKK